MQLRCESLVRRTVLVQGNPKKIKDLIPCNEPGVLYRVRKPFITGPISPGYKGTVAKEASVAIEQILCNRHKKKAIEEGLECIPVPPAC